MAKGQSLEPGRERRRRRRFPLHCKVRFEMDNHCLEATTANIGSGGFYCISDEPVHPGDELRCILDLTHAHRPTHKTSLSCQAVVLRVEHLPQGYGVACSIRNYAMIQPRTQQRLRTYVQ